MTYDYEIAGATGFTEPVARARVDDTASIRLPDPLPPGDYAWRIRSVDASAKPGPFGDCLAFTVRPLAEVTACCSRIKDIENRGDEILFDATEELFSGKFDALHVLKLRDIYKGIENALDMSSIISDVIVNIVLKHS